MALIGMDVEQVRGLANQLDQQSQEIHNVIAQIDKLIGQLMGAWQGKDANDFHNWWNSQHKPALAKAQEAIHGLGLSAKNNADEQERVSSH